jgi:hypothetical protein
LANMTSRNRQTDFSTGETPDRVPGGSRDGAAGGSHVAANVSEPKPDPLARLLAYANADAPAGEPAGPVFIRGSDGRTIKFSSESEAQSYEQDKGLNPGSSERVGALAFDLEGISLTALAESEIDQESILLGIDGNRYVCRGGVMLFVGPSGVGKSTASCQQDVLWSLGRPAFGITPARPLKICTVQAENDMGDQIFMARGIMTALELSAEDRVIVDAHTRYISHNATSGAQFLEFTDQVLSRHKPDLLRIDPLMAYAGGDLTKTEVVATFCRCGLNRLATHYGCAIVVCHHTPKSTSTTANAEARKNWGAFDWQYAGAGSADLANWSRAMLVMEPITRELFAFRAAKRWPGWKDVDGVAEHVRYFQREREYGKVFWHDASLEDATAARATTSAKAIIGPDYEALELQAIDLVTEPMAPSILKARIRSKFGLSKNNSETLLAMLVREGGRLVRWTEKAFPVKTFVGTPQQHKLWRNPALPSLSSLPSCQDDKDSSPPAFLPDPPYRGQVGRQPGGEAG